MNSPLSTKQMIELSGDRDSLMKHFSSDPALFEAIRDLANEIQLPSGDVESLCLPELLPVQRCLGPEMCRSYYQGALKQVATVNHQALSLRIALTAVKRLVSQDARWRLWSGESRKADALTGEPGASRISELPLRQRAAWVSTMMRLAMCMPIGYMISHTRIACDDRVEGWNPSLMDLPDYIERHHRPAKVSVSNLHPSPRMVSYATYQRLFGSRPADSSTLLLAEADFFADHPSRSNPFRLAWRDALLRTLSRSWDLPFPYWWVLAINHELVGREGFRLLTCQVLEEEPSKQVTESSANSAEVVNNPKASNPVDELLMGRDSAVGSELLTPISPLPEPSVQDAPRPKAPRHGEARHAEEQLVPSIATDVRVLIEKGEFAINCKGAVIHKHAGNFYLVHPLFWKLLANSLNDPSKTPEVLQKNFVDAGFVQSEEDALVVQSFGIFPADSQKRAGKLKGVLLNNDFVEMTIIHCSTMADNPDLRLM